MMKPNEAVRIGHAVSIIALVAGFLLLPPLSMLAIWLVMAFATNMFVLWWDRQTAHAHGGPMSFLAVILLALNWPSTLTIWFVRMKRN